MVLNTANTTSSRKEDGLAPTTALFDLRLNVDLKNSNNGKHVYDSGWSSTDVGTLPRYRGLGSGAATNEKTTDEKTWATE